MPNAMALAIGLCACQSEGDSAIDASAPAGGGRYHPQDFADPGLHGAELKLGKQDCRLCHGATLDGQGQALSCDTHHSEREPKAWRTFCIFCHGGIDNATGAPPRNLDGTSTGGVFPPHSRHVGTTMAASIDCIQCHVKPTDVLSVGHVFDATPGRAENVFTAGRSPRGRREPDGCNSLYCHGHGMLDDGHVAIGGAPMTCTSCHAGITSGASGWATMSGGHAQHLSIAGVTCADCHLAVTHDSASIADASLHVNGRRDVHFAAAGFSYDAGTRTCTGTCHGSGHGGHTWTGGEGGGGD
jgi:hypothetical protein